MPSVVSLAATVYHPGLAGAKKLPWTLSVMMMICVMVRKLIAIEVITLMGNVSNYAPCIASCMHNGIGS